MYTKTTTQGSQKRVNVTTVVGAIKEDGTAIKEKMILRTTKEYAALLVAAGTHRYTTKGKLMSFINKDMKLFRNERAIAGLDFVSKKSKNQMFKDEYTGKTYAYIWKKDVKVTMEHKSEVDPNTGRLRIFQTTKPMHEIRIVAFPLF